MKLDSVRIYLPWPDSSLMPNRRAGKHWASYQNAKTKARNDGWAAAKLALGRSTFTCPERVKVRWTFAAPDKRRRDLDGLYGACKHYQDGIAAALGVDDSIFRPVLLDDCLDKHKQGFVIVEIGQ